MKSVASEKNKAYTMMMWKNPTNTKLNKPALVFLSQREKQNSPFSKGGKGCFNTFPIAS